MTNQKKTRRTSTGRKTAAAKAADAAEAIDVAPESETSPASEAAQPTEASTSIGPDTDKLTEMGLGMMQAAYGFWPLQPDRLLQSSHDGVERFNGQLLEDASAMAGRMLEFGNRRFSRSMECMSEFTRCRTPEDVFNVQRTWLETAVDDYRNGSSEIYGAGMRLFTESMTAATELANGMLRQNRDGDS